MRIRLCLNLNLPETRKTIRIIKGKPKCNRIRLQRRGSHETNKERTNHDGKWLQVMTQTETMNRGENK